MYVIMQKDLERRQTMTIAGIASKTREDAQAEFTQWIRDRIIEDGEGEHRETPSPGVYDHQDRALLLDGDITDTNEFLAGYEAACVDILDALQKGRA